MLTSSDAVAHEAFRTTVALKPTDHQNSPSAPNRRSRHRRGRRGRERKRYGDEEKRCGGRAAEEDGVSRSSSSSSTSSTPIPTRSGGGVNTRAMEVRITEETLKKKKKKKKKGKRPESTPIALYEQYLADSGTDNEYGDYGASGEGAWVGEEGEDVLAGAGVRTEFTEVFTVGMDINILIRQTAQNVIQSVCLIDPAMETTTHAPYYPSVTGGRGVGGGGARHHPSSLSGGGSRGRTVQFGDAELIWFAGALKANSSILSIQLKYLPVTDASLVPLCAALHHHPSLRAIDISGTQGGKETSRALRQLVCSNPLILFVGMEDTLMQPADADIIAEAVQYNAMVCPDPSSNPFQLGLLRQFSAMEEKENSFAKSLEVGPWMMAMSENAGGRRPDVEAAAEEREKKRKKNISWATTTHSDHSEMMAQPCSNYLHGECRFGSRCKFYHPEYTPALTNAVHMAHACAAQMVDDSASSVGRGGGGGGVPSVASSGAGGLTVAGGGASRRLQSRLRASHFTLRTAQVNSSSLLPGGGEGAETRQRPVMMVGISLWVMSVSIGVLCAVSLTRGG